MLAKFKSRKFQLTLFTVLTALGAAFADEIAWLQAIQAIVVTVGAYLGIEGAADVVSRFKED